MSELHRGTVLYGMMGCGKTTLGEGLAEHFEQPFSDTDQLIQQRYALTCAEIIANPSLDFGHAQVQAITLHIPTGPEVIATGGSVAMFPRAVEHLNLFGVPIFIEADPEALDARVEPERKAALHNPDRLSFADLYRARIPKYRAATEHTLSVPGDESVEKTLARLIHLRESVN